MTFTADNVIQSARRILQDTSEDRWTEAELLAWLNEAQLKVISIDPLSLCAQYSHTLSAGVKQAVSNSYFRLLSVDYNLNGSGERSSAITRVDEASLLLEDPDWAQSTSSATVMHWMMDARDSLNFRVYPPQPEGTTHAVEITATPYPVVLTSADDDLEFNDEYEQVFVDYVIYRAASQDHANEANDALSAKHFTLFSDQLAVLKGS